MDPNLVQQLAQQLATINATPTTPTYHPESIPSIQAAVTNMTAAIDVHTSEVQLLRDLSSLLAGVQSQLRARTHQESETLLELQAALRKAKLLEAEQQLANSLAPDLNNPELIKLIDILKTWKHYPSLDSYQVEDIVFTLDRWLRTKDQSPDPNNLFTRGIINANDTGMGKTVETTAFLWVMRQVNPQARIIWFTKSPLVKETAPEVTVKWGFDMIPIMGINTKDKLSMLNVILSMPFAPTLAINYEAVNQPEIMKALGTDWDFMVIDEVHKLRGGSNYKPTQMWTNTREFKRNTNAWPMMLSGSIINNRPREMWAFLHLMDEQRFPDVYEFEQIMRAGIIAEQDLLKILAPSMFRRRKDEVDIKMPERVIKHHTITLDPKSELARIYNEMYTQLSAWLTNQEDQQVKISFKSILDQLIRLRGVLVAPGHMNIKRTTVNPQTGEPETYIETLNTGDPVKLIYAGELANELLDEGQQVVILSSGFKAPLDYIADHCIDPRFTCEKLYGKNTAIGGDIAERFRNAQTQVLLTNLQSGAEGFNLQRTKDWPGGAEHLIMIDDWYNPELVRQAWDRVWRRGSLNRVTIHVLQVENSVDLFVEAIREAKTTINSQITESTTLRASDWKKLLLATTNAS